MNDSCADTRHEGAFADGDARPPAKPWALPEPHASALETARERHARAVAAKGPFVHHAFHARTLLVEPYLRVLGYDPTEPGSVALSDPLDPCPAHYTLFRHHQPWLMVHLTWPPPEGVPALPEALIDAALARGVHTAALTDGFRWHWYRRVGRSRRFADAPVLSHHAGEPSARERAWLEHLFDPTFDALRLRERTAMERIHRACEAALRAIETRPDTELLAWALSRSAIRATPEALERARIAWPLAWRQRHDERPSKDA